MAPDLLYSSLSMNKLLALILALGFSTPLWAQSRRGGLSGSGGGSGVACFPNIALAEKADEFLKNKKLLPEELLNQADLKVLEAWELEQANEEIEQPKAGQSWQDYMAEIHSNVHDHFPLFSYRFEQTAKLMKFENWKNKEQYEVIEDANPTHPIPDNCKRIQIIVRHSKGNNALGEGPVYQKPEIEIEYVKRYFDRLPLTSKAMLFSHEQIYILGQSIGHTTSDHMRHFVRLFYSKTLNLKGREELLLKRTSYTFKIKRQLVYYLGDYIKYFIESNPEQKAEPYTAQQHFNTFLALVSRKNKEIGECLDKAKELKYDGRQCLEKVMGNIDPALFTNEEAFLYVSAFGLEPQYLFNVDYAMDPKPLRPHLFIAAMKTLCVGISIHLAPMAPLVPEAVQYCREFHLATDPGK